MGSLTKWQKKLIVEARTGPVWRPSAGCWTWDIMVKKLDLQGLVTIEALPDGRVCVCLTPAGEKRQFRGPGRPQMRVVAFGDMTEEQQEKVRSSWLEHRLGLAPPKP